MFLTFLTGFIVRVCPTYVTKIHMTAMIYHLSIQVHRHVVHSNSKLDIKYFQN